MPTTAKQMVKELQATGFQIISQSGSHIKLRNSQTGITIIVPFHNGDLKKGLEQDIRKHAGLK